MTKPWDKNRKEIVRLYIREGRTLQEVKGIMKAKHNFDASIRSYRQWFDKWDVTKYNCKKRQQRRRMLQQYIKQEACDDRCSSPTLDSSRLPNPKGLPAATSQDQLAGESKPQDPVAEAASLPLPKVEVSQNRNVSPQEADAPWYKLGPNRQWAVTKLSQRKRQPRRKLPQQQHIKQEAYTGLQSPPLDARLPYSRQVDTQDPLTSERKPQDLMAGAASSPSPKTEENYGLSPQAEATWPRHRCQEGAYAPDMPRYQGPEYFGYSTPRYTEPFVFTLSDKPAWHYHDGRVNPSWVDLSPSSLEYDLSVGSDTPGIYEGGSAAVEFAAQSRNSTAADRDLIKL